MDASAPPRPEEGKVIMTLDKPQALLIALVVLPLAMISVITISLIRLDRASGYPRTAGATLLRVIVGWMMAAAFCFTMTMVAEYPLSFGLEPGDIARIARRMVPLFILLLLPALFFGWAYTDGARRGKQPLQIALLVAIGFPLGLLLWLIFRPAPVPPPTRRNAYLPDYLQGL